MSENRSYSSGNPETIAVPREYYEQLKARVERLEEALREITDPGLIMPFGSAFWQKAMKARKALESEDSE